MRLLYATSALYPSQLANRIQILAMGEAFGALLGNNFALGVPSRSTPSPACKLIKVHGSLKSPILAWRYAQIIKRDNYTHVFCREERLLFFIRLYLKILRKHIFCIFEAHWVRHDFFFLNAIQTSKLVVAITDHLRHDLIALGAQEKKIIVAPDAVDLTKYEVLPLKNETRRRYGVPIDAFVVGYTGSIGVHEWKGVHTLLEASKQAPPDVFFWIIGGSDAEVNLLRGRYPSIHFEGPVPHDDIPAIQVACDALVLPNSAEHEMSMRHTSPLKLFEYMASGVPIIASDVPSIREILAPENTNYFKADDPNSLLLSIVKSKRERTTSLEFAQATKEKVAVYTWENRAKKILSISLRYV